MAQLGVDLLSNLDVIANRDLLSLKISLRVERGKDGQWVFLFFY